MTAQPTFSTSTLDELLERAGVDVVLATTRHNVQYLLGGYRYFFFANMDAIGVSRYLPVVGIVRGSLDAAFYIGAGNEDWGTQTNDLWIDDIRNVSWSSVDSARAAATALHERGLGAATIAVERAFIPADALDELRIQLPDATFVEAHSVLETLRGVKSAREIELVRDASQAIIDSMLATFEQVTPGMSKFDIAEVFRLEQTRRHLAFDYVLVAVGDSINRAPSAEVWQPGTSLSLDSGGMLRGYIGDLARMGVDGEPTPRQVDLLEQIEVVQQAARVPVRAGARGADIFDAALAAIAAVPDGASARFVAHGMGLITHEVPRLTSTGPVPYQGTHAEDPLQPGTVLSIETWFEDPIAGFIKLEDTLIVTDDGWDAPGDVGRGWNITGGRA
jgi:Xaa-Pro aminopeptidase